jgi:beta-phosphoglucomutase-like phosphatase (HAD superfamily)
MHPDLIILDCDGAVADAKPGANTIWVEVAAE